MRQALFISAAGMLAVCSGMAFEPPGPQQRLEAIGPTNGLSDVLRLKQMCGEGEKFCASSVETR